VDERNPDATRDFNARMLDLKTAEVSRSVPPDEPEIRKFMIDQLGTEFDHVFGLFVTSTRSPIFKNAFEAASRAITDSMPVRMRAGIKGPLLVECYDSQNLFSGYGVQVLEALREFEAEPLVANIRTHMQELSKSSYGYLAPSNLDFLLTRAARARRHQRGLPGPDRCQDAGHHARAARLPGQDRSRGQGARRGRGAPACAEPGTARSRPRPAGAIRGGELFRRHR
jgi:hypothetical protein